MYNIRPTTKFQKDLKRVKKRGFDGYEMTAFGMGGVPIFLHIIYFLLMQKSSPSLCPVFFYLYQKTFYHAITESGQCNIRYRSFGVQRVHQFLHLHLP